MMLRKIRGVYHAVVTGKGGKRKPISLGVADRGEALRIVSESGVTDLERAARAGRLTREAIGHITTGRKLTMDKTLKPFEEWLTACARSPKTINNSLTQIRCWLREMKIGVLSPAAVTIEHISKWVNNPKSKLKSSSRAIRLSCVRTLFAFMAANGWIVTDVSQLVQVDYSIMSHEQKESHERVPFTDDELAKLVEFLENNNEKFWLFAVLCSRENGLRLGDICQLEWACFVGEPDCMTVWTDKRNKRVTHKMSPELMAAFREIVPVDPTYLFPEHRTLILDVKKRGILSVQFARILGKVEIAGKSFHCLRHTAATEMAKANGESKLDLAKRLVKVLDKKEIAKLLGHSNTKTTEGYIHDKS